MKRKVLAIALSAIACAAANAQSADARLTLDAASVKPAPPPDGRGGRRRVAMMGGPGTDTPGRINFENVGLGAVIVKAYGLKYYQISGPDWLDTERFNIIATVAPGTTPEQFRTMLQNLLADRFKLQLHKETREIAIYSLVVAKNGRKLKEAAPDPPPDANGHTDASPAGRLATDANGYPVLRPGMTMAMMGGRARIANKDHMQWLVDMLSGQTGRPVVDNTGLTGKYEFSLSWIPQPPGADPNAAEDPAGPDLFAALREQLGLKLEPKKGPVDVLVIDHAEKTPTAN